MISEKGKWGLKIVGIGVLGVLFYFAIPFLVRPTKPDVDVGADYSDRIRERRYGDATIGYHDDHGVWVRRRAHVLLLGEGYVCFQTEADPEVYVYGDATVLMDFHAGPASELPAGFSPRP